MNFDLSDLVRTMHSEMDVKRPVEEPGTKRLWFVRKEMLLRRRPAGGSDAVSCFFGNWISASA